jgi:hypothetical protein
MPKKPTHEAKPTSRRHDKKKSDPAPSSRPSREHLEALLDEALEESFPASDTPRVAADRGR